MSEPEVTHNVPEFTVGQISGALQRTVEQAFARVRVRGEISGFKRAPSGHLYFNLKDQDAVLGSVCWKGVAARLPMRPEDGMEVIATGKLTTYPGQSKYQMVVDGMELAGKGALLALIEERKRRLAAEGLFDPSRKQKLPFLPKVIGVVTSPTGAVIRDILHRLADRFPRHVLVWPVLVQGEQAASQIAAAIDGFNRLEVGGSVPRPDVLIVARGGGSIEDLMAFNEEIVVRAAAASAIPLISAVGHETDTTLIDFASDRRAPTPTAAAEMAVPVRAELRGYIQELGHRQTQSISRQLERQATHLAGLARGLPDPQSVLDTARQRLDDRAERLAQAVAGLTRDARNRLATLSARLPHPQAQLALSRSRLEGLQARLRLEPIRAEIAREQDKLAKLAGRLPLLVAQVQGREEERLAGLRRLLEGYSYKGTLARGFAVIRDANGHAVTEVAALKSGQPVDIELADGRKQAVVGGTPSKPRPATPTPPSSTPGQGSLL
ncbi:exodeoxyribonuclease VII large subunit [Lacibacterium aquatile]|uniref:Exodeoxyribonuclease 7 large subunit n=1 Tax=Lacibacterium aquatile TaxID=1168082 RepID=A0ABW5DQN5_9PROT